MTWYGNTLVINGLIGGVARITDVWWYSDQLPTVIMDSKRKEKGCTTHTAMTLRWRKVIQTGTDPIVWVVPCPRKFT